MESQIEALKAEIKADMEEKGLVNAREEELIYDRTVDFVHELVEADEKAMEGGSPKDKTLWITRHAYLSGFEQGIQLYNEMIDIATGLNRSSLLYQVMEAGMLPQVLKTILGHSSLAMTMDLYSHVLPDTKAAEVEKIAGAF